MGVRVVAVGIIRKNHQFCSPTLGPLTAPMLAIRPDQVRLLRTSLRCRRAARFRSKNLPLCRSVIWVEYMLNDQHAAVWSHSIPAIAQGLWAGKLLTRRT